MVLAVSSPAGLTGSKVLELREHYGMSTPRVSLELRRLSLLPCSHRPALLWSPSSQLFLSP